MIVALNKADLLSSDIIQIASIAMELPYVQVSALDEECFEANGTRIRGPTPKNHSGPLLAFQQLPTKRLRA